MRHIIRSWKNPEYRAELKESESASIPTNPAGESWDTIDQMHLRQLVGGAAEGGEVATISHARSCGYICTITTEAPIFSFCCTDSNPN